jgi:hypothetical protein
MDVQPSAAGSGVQCANFFGELTDPSALIIWRTHQELNLTKAPVNQRKFRLVDTKRDTRIRIFKK